METFARPIIGSVVYKRVLHSFPGMLCKGTVVAVAADDKSVDTVWLV